VGRYSFAKCEVYIAENENQTMVGAYNILEIIIV